MIDYYHIDEIEDAYLFLKQYLETHSDDGDLRFHLETILSFVSLECGFCD